MINNIESTVVSTRVRLARNLAGYPFPNRLESEAQAREIVRMVQGAASRLRSFNLYYMNEISEEVAQAICDDHLISTDLVASSFGAALIDEEEAEEPHGKFSIMVNEEDHLREQYILRGLNLPLAYKKISAVDDELSRSLPFAFDGQLGYLTACPTNLGTGLRASVMLFLPGLTRTDKIEPLVAAVAEKGHTVRGVYGEGSAAEGYMYQVSNEVTIGYSEEQILEDVQGAVLEIVRLESQARKALRAGDTVGLKDECCRAVGILSHCERISYAEFLQLASSVKLGAALGFLDISEFSWLDEFISSMRPANLSLFTDVELTPAERDIYRARECRNTFAGVRRSEESGKKRSKI